MTYRFQKLHVLGLALLGTLALSSTLHSQSLIQLGLIVDASSSAEDELPTFRKGVGDALATLKTDGTLELTLVEFSAEGRVIFGPAIIDSASIRQEAVNAALAIDPSLTEIPPFNGGTNLEDGFLETLVALQASPNAPQASLQFINMLSDGHPTSHNHLDFSDFDGVARHQRGQTFALQQRDALVAAGVDVISFEALGSSSADLDYLKTLAYPEPAVVVSGSAATFPSPITDNGFLLPISTVDGISAALTAKFEAAGFATAQDPDPLFGIDQVAILAGGGLQLSWTGRQGLRYQVEYSGDMRQWHRDLPNALLVASTESATLNYTATDLQATGRYYRVVQLEE